jgi:hypothetical protein
MKITQIIGTRKTRDDHRRLIAVRMAQQGNGTGLPIISSIFISSNVIYESVEDSTVFSI